MKLTETQERELSGTNVNEIGNLESGKNEKNVQDIEQKEIEGTPFTMVTETSTGNKFLTIGQYRVTEQTKNEKELLGLTKGIKWNFLTNVVSVVVETYLNAKETERRASEKNPN